MRLPFWLTLFAFVTNGLSSPAASFDSPPSLFSSYVRQAKYPEIFYVNSAAFEARLKLLDMAPPGAKAKIATFLFDNGVAVRQLARHMCNAAQRGVNVELVVDSKSGGRPGAADNFDFSEDAQVVEEIYQYMANCGVHIYVHNQLSSFIDVRGVRLPNLFLDPNVNGKRFRFLDLLTVKHRIDELAEKIGELVQEETKAAGIRGDARNIVKNLKSLLMEFMSLASVVEKGREYATEPPIGYDDSVAAMEKYYRRLVTDPFWAGVSPERMADALNRIELRFKRDAELGPLYQELRRFNRLNHRKLFLVEWGKDGCMFLGGRNLGDHYLTDSKDSFLDGDVMLCRHQGAKIAYTFDSAKASFEELKHDLEDPILTASSDNTVHEIPADPNFVFKHLIFPRGAALSGTRTERYRGSLPESARTLGEMRLWADTYNVPAFITLDASDNWRFLKAGWDPSRDEVQASLLDLIRNERKELFIETPYAEFDATLRKALEDAMARGVRVHLITNSFFMSDGFSRVIRITMANWMRKTLAAYPENFRVRYVTYDAGHMTHFKGAAFTCQRSGLKTVRTFLLGSHNFDPRSGRSDKDHAVMWDEPSDCSSLAQMPAVSGRNAFYAHLSQKLNIPVLAPYSDFGQELQNVSKLYKKSEPTRLMAQALMRVFYVNTQNGYVLNQASKVEYLLQLMDDGGLHDLFGRVL